MRRFATLVVFAVLVATVAAPATAAVSRSPASTAGSGRAGGSGARADFNGDGFSDMAVGVPRETIGGLASAGAVNVIYGSAGGLASAGNQFFTQNSPGVPTASQTGGRFGISVAAGDFNGDGFSDLAVGADGEDVGAATQAGVVIVLYGTRAGLTTSGSQLFDQDSELMAEVAENDDNFGVGLAAGNFGRTPQDDLAIGVGDESVGANTGAGAVQVVYGSLTGLSQNGNQLFTEDTPGVTSDGAEPDDHMGGFFGQESMLAAANLGKDGHADLAVGVVGESVGSVANAGAVLVLYGGPGGLAPAGSQFWTQDAPGVADAAETGDVFGAALAAGNFGKSPQADLAIGAPGEGLAHAQCGAVTVLYGSPAGLTGSGSQLWAQDTPGIKDQCDDQGTSSTGDDFGDSLAAANFGKSGQADLAVGAIGEDLGTADEAGAVNVIYGTSTGLAAAGNQFWNQGSPGILEDPDGTGASTAPDFFGFSMLAVNFGKSGQADLAISVWGRTSWGTPCSTRGP